MIRKLFKPYSGLPREIYIIFISKTINALGALIYPTLTLILSKKIGLSNAETGFYVALMGILHAPASIIGGKLSDKYGRKKILLGFEFIAAILYMLCIFIEPSMTLVYTLMLAAFCFGVAGPSHDAMTADLTTGDQRQGAYSMNYLGFNLGFAGAQLYVGFLFENHFKWLFIIDAATAALGLLLVAVFVKETLHNTKHEEENDNNGNKNPKNLEENTKTSTLKVILSRPIIIYFVLAAIGYRFVYAQWPFMMPLHVEHNFVNQGAKIYGYMGTLNAVIVVSCTPIITTLLMKKTNIRRIIYAGIFFTIGFGMLGFISTKTAFFISVITFTIGEILEAISLPAFIMSHTPASHRGRMGSVLFLIIGLGYTMGSLVMGNILEVSSFETGWKIAAITVLISTVLMVLLEKYDNIKRNENKDLIQIEE